ncbi:M16 family metallopeptidase [Pseudothauera rhizosphaerae]|nr:pitrilysin family protein [Pseudothauera rhizosphaerae]
MTRIRFLHALATTLCLCAAAAAQAGPQIQHWIADTGARVYFVESRALPMVDIQVDFAAGSAFEPAGKAGLASLTRGLLDAGTATLDEQAIADRTADIGARIGGGADDDRASLSVRTLSAPAERDAAVALGAELLARPGFPQDVLERERARSIAGLREALTQPGNLAARSFSGAIYGDHPYGRVTTEESLTAITRDDLVRFHREHYGARRASVAIVGDVSRAEAAEIARRLTADLPPGEAPAPLAAPQQPARHTVRVPHPSAQAHLLLGLPGMAREDPDYYPLLVGNYVLGGGGFVSRLTREVREKRGYAYSVYSYFSPQWVAGPFQIGLQTRGSQIDAALGLVEKTLAAFIAEGPTEAELQAARDNIVNGFGLRLDSNSKILGYVSMIGFYGLPLDWLDAYPRHVEEVTAAAVRDAFARRVRPEHLVTVVVGGDGDNKGNGNAAAAPATGPAR